MNIDVILPLPLEGTFTYRAPDTLSVTEGMRVLVPFGRSKVYTGIVDRVRPDGGPAADSTTEDSPVELRDICGLPDAEPLVTPVQLRLWHWIADYYMCPLGEVYTSAMPSALRLEGRTEADVRDPYRPKTVTQVTLAETYRSEAALQQLYDRLRRAVQQQRVLSQYLLLTADQPYSPVARDTLLQAADLKPAALTALVEKGVFILQQQTASRLKFQEKLRDPFPLSSAQAKALQEVQQQWEGQQTVLLHGVTSSGKTEIYIHLIEQQLRAGRQVLYLVPEIALTTQLVERLGAVFGHRLGVYHSRFSDAERVETYLDRLHDGSCQVVLGARSAVFLPFSRLGLVIVDEEHETSFRQQETAPRYHARNVALVLAQMHGAKVLLGSATPSVESYHNALTHKYGYVSLTARYRDTLLPEIRLTDMRESYRKKLITGHFDDRHAALISEAVGRHEQVILFQNRRGYSPYVECRACGNVPRCPHCDVSLTLHKASGSLTCHYCGYRTPAPAQCPNCGAAKMSERGMGTERIEDEVKSICPQARVHRLDLDSTRAKGAYRQILDDFDRHKIDILVGTQMVTKGLDFNNVSLVGVLNADNLFNRPDFRAFERAFQTLEQVSGRAGRANARGVVVVQTRQPEHPVLQFLQNHDYAAFALQELEERRTFKYPPFHRLITIVLRHRDREVVEHAARHLGSNLALIFGSRCSGSVTPEVSRSRNLYIRHIVLRIEAEASVAEAKRRLAEQIRWISTQPAYKNINIYVEVD